MPEVTSSKYLVQAGWDDVPHLAEQTKAELLRSTMPYMRDARSKGTPSLGAGAIYPIPESEIMVDPFAIPRHWVRCYGMDVGWKRTAALWCAIDRDTDTAYIYTEHYMGKNHPSTHATSIRARGEWIPGVIDPAARGRSQRDGEQLLVDYINLGLDLQPTQNAVEAGIFAVWERLSTGRLKVFSTCQYFWYEYRFYRRDQNGNIVKENDHLMDCLRYIVLSGMQRATIQPIKRAVGFSSGVADTRAGY